ncbi:alanine racemase [Aurantimicrobium minutum]|uniref:alanine racemase n=1 Tax=Aurantimicrobium minutum TaxID=708131 RepID=UPI0024748980|nr:alanine racemase [Aurantimicrobium minutum]MDH6277664.1 alanine racemase [Aurantimicrobium minutum]
MSHTPFRIAKVNTDAIAGNVKRLYEITGVDDVLIVVKANAYGHGMVPAAKAALAGGATWLGTADIAEALVLREAGITVPVLCWIHAPDETFDEAVENDITLGAVSVSQLNVIAAAGHRAHKTPRVHLKLDTGLSRNGSSPEQWADFMRTAAELHASGDLDVEGVMSHLSNTSDADDLEQLKVFTVGLSEIKDAGLEPQYVHLAASLAALTLPETRFNMVRSGIAAYGIAPTEELRPEQFGLTPAMTLETRVVAVRRVPENTGVSYGYLHRTAGENTLALIPLGYGDGINRDASMNGPVLLNGETYPVAGRIAMDQFLLNVGDDPVVVGDHVVLFGDPALGQPSVHDWAAAANSIAYEIVTRLIGTRLDYEYVGNA